MGPVGTVVPVSKLGLMYLFDGRRLAFHSAMPCRKLEGDASWQMYQTSSSEFVQIADLGHGGTRADLHDLHGHIQSQRFG
jgi:hypothetical protein